MPHWQHRESERFETGYYKPPVWHTESWWLTRSVDTVQHYTHTSRSNPAMLAYTPDADKGERDIQTQIKPGRYLARFFPHLTDKQRAFFATWQTTGAQDLFATAEDADPYALAFASTADDVVRVYTRGPSSCMDGRHFPNDSDNPTRVYAAGDLAIAYLTRKTDGKIIGRAVCWPARYVVGRVYPTPDAYYQDGYASHAEAQAIYDTLLHRMRAAGYRSTYESHDVTLAGAKLAKIRASDSDCWLMPYLDQGYGVTGDADDDETPWIMARPGHADYRCDETNGTLRARRRVYAHCDRCGDPIHSEDDAHTVVTRVRHAEATEWETYCDDCNDNSTFHCHGIGDTVSDDVENDEANGHTYCTSWLRENAYTSDRSNAWHITDDDPPVTMADGSTWTQSEFDEDGFTCAITGDNYDNDDAHPEHPGICANVDAEDLAAWLETQTQDATP